MDWNYGYYDNTGGNLSRSPRGSVDWNFECVRENAICLVAPLVGAWIEILCKNPAEKLKRGRSPRGSVDWNNDFLGGLDMFKSRSPRGSVDWNQVPALCTHLQISSLPSWERGLKCLYLNQQTVDYAVAPLVGAWIEIVIVMWHKTTNNVAPLVGAWIEIPVAPNLVLTSPSRSPRGSVDWNHEKLCGNEWGVW